MADYRLWINGIEKCCAKCAHYYPHYVWVKQFGCYSMLYSGHCSHPEYKCCRPEECCERFEKL